jgi:hypothetical protein
MALSIELSLAIASTRTSATLSDDTVYGTGGNPARNTLAVYAKAYKVSYTNESTALTTTGDDSDPETDSSWVITLSDEDGYNKVNFAIIPFYNIATTYARYDAVYDEVTAKVYRSLQNANTGNSVVNTTWFEEITSPADLAANKDTSTESGNITSVVYQRVLSPNSQYEFANQLSAQCACSDCDEDESLQQYNIFAQWLDAVAVADSRTEVLEGELLCRRIQSKFID